MDGASAPLAQAAPAPDGGAATRLAAAAVTWLPLACLAAGVEAGHVLLVENDAPGAVAAAHGQPVAAGATAAARAAIAAGETVGARPVAEPDAAYAASPVAVGGRCVAVVVLRAARTPPGALRAAGAFAPLLAAALAAEAERSRAQGLAARLDGIMTANAALSWATRSETFRAAAQRVVAELARMMGADRVSFGLARGAGCAVHAISHSAGFVRRAGQSRLIAEALNEALAQRAVLRHPAPRDARVATGALAALSRDRGASAVLAAPFAIGGVHAGAFVVERPGDRPFSEAEGETLEAVAALAGPALSDKRRVDRILPLKVWDTLGNQAGALLGPGRAARKAGVAAALLAALILSQWRVADVVVAQARVEGGGERRLVAPTDGFLAVAPHRAGDHVAEGALIAALDDAELTLERLRWRAEFEEHRLEYGRAIGAGERAAAELLRARMGRAQAQIDVIDAQMARMRVLSPFDGVLIEGDRSDDLGGTVARGELLFTIARADALRLVVVTPETRIARLAEGQTGRYTPTGLPDRTYPIQIAAVRPIAEVADGANVFEVDAAIATPTDALRPGMRGVARIETGDALLVDVLTRDVIDWLTLAAWRWFG